ncbi:MAG: hypothetical protein AB8F78_10495 [Saprospiraceae bacterium]
MKNSTLFPLLFLFFIPLSGISQAVPDQGLRNFTSGISSGIAGLVKGGSIYVANNTSALLTDEIMYDFPTFRRGKAYSIQGEEYEITGRYVFPTGEIEILINGRTINRLDPGTYPLVQLSDRVYAFVQFEIDGELSRRFAYLKAGELGPEKHSVVTTYKIEIPSNAPSHRGIVSTPPSRLRVDSTNYLIGDRPLAVILDRKTRRNSSLLTPCAFEALKDSQDEGKYGSVEQLRAFVRDLDKACLREN